MHLQSISLVPRLAFPERTLVASLELNGKLITACSFHTPPGVSWGEVKPRTLKAIARWLARQTGPLIFGIDANCPKTDHPDINKNEWWWDDEALLLGSSPLHGLRDVFRIHLESNPIERDRIVAARPNGPLATSYIRGSRRKIACRYDFIYASPDIGVAKVDYRFDRAIKAASDHALVVADLDITLSAAHIPADGSR